MPSSKITSVLLGAFLAVSLTPTDAGATGEHATNTVDSEATQNAHDETNEIVIPEEAEASQSSNERADAAEPVENTASPDAVDTSTDTTEAVDNATIVLIHNNTRTSYDTLSAAISNAQSGDVIEIASDQVLDSQLVITNGVDITLRATAKVTITRSSSFTTANDKPAGMILLEDGASLTLERANEASSLTLHGEDKDSTQALVTLYGSSTFTMGKGVSIVHARCSWSPWGAVYVNSGKFVLDGGEIRDNFAMRNAAVAVEANSSFEMNSGVISQNRASYSQTMVWTKGNIHLKGGTIENNLSNVSNDGVVQVLSGGSLIFDGGTIGDNNPNNTFGVRVDTNGSLTLGENAHFKGVDRIDLNQGARLSFSGVPASHNTDNPIDIVLSGTWADGTLLATTTSSQDARDILTRLSVKHGGAQEKIASVGIDSENESHLALASSEVKTAFEILDNPFNDYLALDLRDELDAPDALDQLRNTVEDHFAGIDTPERRVRLQQIDRLEHYVPYFNTNYDAIASSVIELSELGDPGVEAQRTQQGYQFDNLDATGLYLKPGRKNEIVIYVEAQDPSKLSVAWRQVGVTDNNNYLSLNLQQKHKLAHGENRITVDLSDKQHGYMLYLRNDSTSNPARVRIEAEDAPYIANGAGTLNDSSASTSPMLGSSLEEHPLYEHDPDNPELFWNFVQDVKEHAANVQAGKVDDMALLQMGDNGHAQFALRATVLAKAYANINSQEEATAYITRSNKAIQDRFEFFWAFDGYSSDDENGSNAISPARVHTAFTSTVTDPSTLYAYMRYFHMPEDYVAPFLSGDEMYSWGMSHEYGHMLDNSIIAVGEETNNLYSIAGSRQGGIEALLATNTPFDPQKHYHENVIRATERRDEELTRMAADPTYVPDWMNGDNWGTYIWTHVTTWWNALHFFDDWDYDSYDFDASPYTQEIASDVERYGAYGATVRILRSDANAVKTIQELAAHATSGGKFEKYNRMAVAFTMSTGYNFAEYLYNLGEHDLAPEVLEWCSKYPSMPRKVQYFSINTDAAIINGAKTYAELEDSVDAVAPHVDVQTTEDGHVQVEATMATDNLEHATTAYELYRNDTLIGFSRDGSFKVAADAGASNADAASADGESTDNTGGDTFDPAAYSVVAYDVRLNPSRAANVHGPIFDNELPDENEPESDGEFPGGNDNVDGDTGNGDTSTDSGNGDTSTDGDNNTGGGNDDTTGGGSNESDGDSQTDGDASDSNNQNNPLNDEGAVEQEPNGSPLTAEATGRLAETGDTSIVPVGLAAAGAVIALIGALIARRFRKS